MQPATSRLSRFSIRAALVAAASSILICASGAGAIAGQATKQVVKQAQSPTLERTVLTTTKGRTLYSLSVEKNGKFICTGSCLTVWHPLVVPAGVKPTGPVKLGTIVRPDGRVQVTFRGRPLYSFTSDTKPGEANGEGIKDVGTWHAASGPQPKPSPQQPESPPPNGYGY